MYELSVVVSADSESGLTCALQDIAEMIAEGKYLGLLNEENWQGEFVVSEKVPEELREAFSMLFSADPRRKEEQRLYLELAEFSVPGQFIAPAFLKGLVDYVAYGKRPNEFLTGMICRDFDLAVKYSNTLGQVSMLAISVALVNHTFSACHGSREKMEAWLKFHPCNFNKGES